MVINCLLSPLYGFDLSANQMVYETDFNPEVREKSLNILLKLFPERVTLQYLINEYTRLDIIPNFLRKLNFFHHISLISMHEN